MLGEPPSAILRSAKLSRSARVSGNCLAARGTFCRSCGEQCEPKAMRFQLLPGGRSLPLIDDERCNACGDCVRVCPAQALSLQVVETAAA